MTTLAALAAAALSAHGMPTDLAATIAVSEVPGLNGSSAAITVGYDVVKDGATRRKVVAETLLESVDDAVALLADQDRLGGLLGQAIAAMPVSLRPSLPAWVAESREAKRAVAMRARAAELSEAAMERTADQPSAA